MRGGVITVFFAPFTFYYSGPSTQTMPCVRNLEKIPGLFLFPQVTEELLLCVIQSTRVTRSLSTHIAIISVHPTCWSCEGFYINSAWPGICVAAGLYLHSLDRCYYGLGCFVYLGFQRVCLKSIQDSTSWPT